MTTVQSFDVSTNCFRPRRDIHGRWAVEFKPEGLRLRTWGGSSKRQVRLTAARFNRAAVSTPDRMRVVLVGGGVAQVGYRA